MYDKMDQLETIIDNGEKENVEFKEFLKEDVHLKDDRRQGLACQMKHRLIMGHGTAIYVLGVTDGGSLNGISHSALEESLSVLNCIAIEAGAKVVDCKEYAVDGGHVALATIKSQVVAKEHILVGTAGHVDHGKSTLVASLVTGMQDDGSGKTRIFLDVLPHEIERGLSADLSYGVYGFRSGKTIRLKNPLSKKEKAGVVESAEKLISFVDTVGHEPWLRTTIRGIVGQKLDYGLLVVAADDGVTHVTREHLGILLAMDLPTIVAITKVDRVNKERVAEVERHISDVLKTVGRIPLRIKSKSDLRPRSGKLNKLSEGIIVPIIRTSAVTKEGFDILDRLLFLLPQRNAESAKSFQMYIDKAYQVSGVGTVVSGSIKQGEVKVGDQLRLGPTPDGKVISVKAQSIEMHYYRIDKASAGDIVGIALKGISPKDIRRGMVLCADEPEAVREFEAEVLILNHPTCIKCGYEPVVHMETIAEAATFKQLDCDYMMAGQTGLVRMRFKFCPYHIYEGQKFIFREGKSKGIGRVVRVFET